MPGSYYISRVAFIVPSSVYVQCAHFRARCALAFQRSAHLTSCSVQSALCPRSQRVCRAEQLESEKLADSARSEAREEAGALREEKRALMLTQGELSAARMELAASGGAREEVADRQRVERLRRPELAEVGQVEQQRDGEIDRPVPTGCVHGLDAVFGAPHEARGLQVLNTAEHG